MDSYEYYLLYHKDSSGFITAISADNKESLIALQKLVEKNVIKFETEKAEIFQKVWSMVQESEPNDNLDKVFETLLTPERREIVKYYVNLQLANFEKSRQMNVLRVTMILVKNIMIESTTSSFLSEIANNLIEILLKDSNHHSEVLHILRYILDKNQTLRVEILNSIIIKCQGRQDKLALQCLSDFFDKICEEETISIKFNDILQKFFENYSKNQTVFVIKTLIHRKKFNAKDEESFKKLTIILESLEENQSHLILPSLSLLKTIKFSQDYINFWFIIVKMILAHENSLIRNWGLNFVLATMDHQFQDEEIATILSALNATYLFDPDQKPISLDLLYKFINRNWKTVFDNLEDINWVSVPCYRILKIVTETFSPENFEINTKSIKNLLNQTETIPKKVKNLVIRSGVQEIFSQMTSKVIQIVGVLPVIQILVNIDNIKENSDCLQKCFEFIQPEDFEHIFNKNHPESFLKSAIKSLSRKISFEKLKILCENIENHTNILMKIFCQLHERGENYSPEIMTCIQDLLCQPENLKNLEALKSLELGLKSLKGPQILSFQEAITEILKIFESSIPETSFSYFYLLKIALEVGFQVPATERAFVNMKNVPCEELRTVLCQLHVLQADKFNSEELSIFLSNFQNIDDLKVSCEIMGKLIKSNNEELPQIFATLDRMLDRVLRSDDKTDYVEDITKVFLTLAECNSMDGTDQAASYLNFLMENLSSNDKSKSLECMLKHNDISAVFDKKNSLREWFKQALVEKVIETDILTKEQQIEMMTSREIEANSTFESLTINEKMMLRLKAAKILSTKFKEEFPVIIENYMEDFAKASKKKPRYFPNSWIHRMKLHCLQPIVMCEGNLTQRTIEILIEEILKINNQLNVSILIEIILSRHYPSIIEILKDDQVVADLKSPAFKSIFAIAVMQMRMEDSFTLLSEKFFGIAEMKLEAIHDLIIPFTMGQNYSVRSYAQAAIIILYKHVKSVFGARESQIMSRIDRSCSVIKESMKFKNASKFIEILKQDFRFSMKFDEIFTVESFYYFIPLSSKMPAEEIIFVNENCQKTIKFKIAEMENETESQVMGDEIVVPAFEKVDPTSISLQQKYLPYKYQIPGENLLSTLPNIFENSEGHLKLRQRSNLIVVASLIDRAPNLGGLARTCEVFGTENYVIDSLKLTENSEFKALSKTAEKWLKISEVKSWQLFDYLIGMKHRGYSIVGAEQSGNSVSLVDVAIPEKCVLLLGNEKEGIPADLLSLLDIIIEIPQHGVIRSLNVHVTGGIIIWEYAKQHLIKK